MRTITNPLTSARCLRLILKLHILAFVILSGFEAHAYVFWYCETGVPKWDSPSTTMHISANDFPSGSVFYSQLKRAMTSWNYVAGSSFTFYWGLDSDGLQIDNNTPEIYYSLDPDPSEPDELAVTIRSGDCYTYWEWEWGHWGLKTVKKITDMDILFNSDTSKVTWSSTYPLGGYSFEGVALHELGHVIGLYHENDVPATMNRYYPNSGPVGYLKEWTPLGDDRNGVRSLYPDSTTERDIAASPRKMNPSTVPEDHGESVSVDYTTSARQGENIYMEYTVSNLGTQQETYNIGFYLSMDNDITTSDILLGTVTGASLRAGESRTDKRDYDLTIPYWVVPGTYYLGFIVDYNNTIPENNESNNFQPMPETIKIDVDAARLIPTVILPLLLD